MSKYLIINADDYGMCRSANEAVAELFEAGQLLSSTVMTPCAAAPEALRFASEHPQYAIGVHLTMTSEWKSYRWKPLTGGKTLVDADGFMWHESDEVEKHASYKDLEAEIRAQIKFAADAGLKPSHIDNHMGSLYGHYTGRLGLSKMTLRICGEYGYAYRLFTRADKRICPRGTPYILYAAAARLSKSWTKKYNVITPDYLMFPDWNDSLRADYETYREKILQIWSDIPDGFTETFVHPAVESNELKGITSRWRDRVWEYRIMQDEYAKNYLKDSGVKLISYRDLQRLKK